MIICSTSSLSFPGANIDVSLFSTVQNIQSYAIADTLIVTCFLCFMNICTIIFCTIAALKFAQMNFVTVLSSFALNIGHGSRFKTKIELAKCSRVLCGLKPWPWSAEALLSACPQAVQSFRVKNINWSNSSPRHTWGISEPLFLKHKNRDQ